MTASHALSQLSYGPIISNIADSHSSKRTFIASTQWLVLGSSFFQSGSSKNALPNCIAIRRNKVMSRDSSKRIDDVRHPESTDLSQVKYELERFFIGGAFDLCEEERFVATLEPECCVVEI